MHNERESCKERQLQNVSLWNWNENRPNNIGFGCRWSVCVRVGARSVCKFVDDYGHDESVDT